MLLMVDRITFGEWLQRQREDRGWTQAEFARRSGKDRAVISKIESGGALPAVETFIAMAEALDVSPMLLFRKSGLLPDIPEDKVRLEDWETLLSDMHPDDIEEIRAVATLKIRRRKDAEQAARAANFKPGKQPG